MTLKQLTGRMTELSRHLSNTEIAKQEEAAIEALTPSEIEALSSTMYHIRTKIKQAINSIETGLHAQETISRSQ